MCIFVHVYLHMIYVHIYAHITYVYRYVVGKPFLHSLHLYESILASKRLAC